METKKIITLTREDLTKLKTDLPLKKISYDDFKSSSISMEEIQKAEAIIFKDDGETKILKSRY